MSNFYILAGHEPVPVDILTWAKWSERRGDFRRIALTEVREGVHVSTVFLGFDHSFGHGPPLLFETMAFGKKLGDHENDCDRYSTWDEAERGHKDMVMRVLAWLAEAAGPAEAKGSRH